MIIGNLATYPPRLASMLSTASIIAPQVDVLNIVLNEYSEVPVELARLPQVHPIIPDRDLKDTGKFLPKVADADMVVLLDDDLGYPKDYVARSLERMSLVQLDSFVAGYHGTIYRRVPFSMEQEQFAEWREFMRNKIDFRKTNAFWRRLDRAKIVAQLGTGTVFLSGRHMPPFRIMKSSVKFVDVRFALWCYRRKLPMVCLPRDDGWLGKIDLEESIYRSFTLQAPWRVRRELNKFAAKVPRQGVALDGECTI